MTIGLVSDLVNVPGQSVVEVLQTLSLLSPGQLDSSISWHLRVGIVLYSKLSQTPGIRVIKIFTKKYKKIALQSA